MCGISGIVGNNLNDCQKNVSKMIIALNHRGPDASGMVSFNNCVLGHNRLSIVDLATGQQPMYSYDKNKAVVFNGEIYGYQELKNNLDYPYQTKSDTEVILAAYEKYQEDLVVHLPGVFAFGIWDNNKKELFLARDRFGEKPLYYTFGTNGEFIFASEIKAILATNLVNPILDRESLNHYLRYLYAPVNKTIYKNIFTLPPAHSLVYKNNEIKIKKYWDLPVVKTGVKIDDAVENFKFLLEKSVKNQMIADVPVGAFLSGGLDSSTIVALASKFSSQPLKTFSFGFSGLANELPYALEISKKYKTEHVELYADDNLAELLLKMSNIYDEPFADSSNIPTYLIAREAKKYVTVALSGDGGDEFCGGYGWYHPFLYAGNTKKIQRSQFYYLLVKIAARLNPKLQFLFWQAQAGKGDSSGDWQKFHKELNSYFTAKELCDLGLPETNNNAIMVENFNNPSQLDVLDYMPGDILVKTDRASMANALELRAPFLDVDFANFCLSLPFSLKINKIEDKIILRKAFANTWTDNIRKRSKQGFGAPVKIWLQNKDVENLKNDYLKNKNRKIFNLISYNNSRKFVEANNYRTWILLVLAVWLEDKNLT